MQKFAIISVIDRVFACLLTGLAALPFSQVMLLRLGFTSLDAYQAFYVLILMCLVLKILLVRGFYYPGPFLASVALSLLYILYSYMTFSVSPLESLRHLRFFAPFFIATLVMAVGCHFPFNTYITLMVLAAMTTTVSALYIHFLAPNYLENALSENESLYRLATEHGRLYWTNHGMAFLAMFALFIPRAVVPRIFVALVVFLSVGAIFATSNRTTLFGSLLFSGGALLISGGIAVLFKRLRITAVILAGSFLLILGLMQADPRILQLVRARIFGEGDLLAVYEEAVVESRYDLYATYAELGREFFPLGMGLGRPYLTNSDGTPVFNTDVSVLSFALPFGIFGIALFAYFIWRLAVLVWFHSAADRATKLLLLLLLSVFLLMSLNFDFFSRNNLVIHLTVLAFFLSRNNNSRGDLPSSSRDYSDRARMKPAIDLSSSTSCCYLLSIQSMEALLGKAARLRGEMEE